MRARVLRGLFAVVVTLGITLPASAQVTTFSADVNTAIDRGLQWMENSGYFNYGAAGDTTGLVTLSLLEKRASAAQNATGQGYAGASAADQAKLDVLVQYLIDTQASGFYSYRNGQEMMALALYLRTGGPNQTGALAALNTAFDESVKQIARTLTQNCYNDWWGNYVCDNVWTLTGNYPTQAQVNDWHGYWCYNNIDCEDASTAQFVISGLAAARGIYSDPSSGDATRLAVLDMVAARTAARYAAGVASQGCAPGGYPLSPGELGAGYSPGSCATFQQTGSGTWIQLVGGSNLNSPGVQSYLAWLRNRYNYVDNNENDWGNMSYGYGLWSTSKALAFLEDGGLTPNPGGLSTADLGVLDNTNHAGNPSAYGRRQLHVDPTTAPRPAVFGAGAAGYYNDPRELPRWYFDFAYTVISRQDASGFFNSGSGWSQPSEQAYHILILQRSVGGGCLDADGDGACDADDNCPQVANANQADGDSDGVGDACDACVNDPDNDADHDGVCGDVDACPKDAQNDADQDGVCGDVDACPTDPLNDVDHDGVCGDVDNCPTTPNPDQADANGVNDGDGRGDACENQPPVAADQSLTTAEDTPLPIALTATDPDNNPLTYAVLSATSHGTLSGVGPNVVYTPNANYCGPDALTFQANDGLVDSNVATVVINVTCVNDPPVANPDSKVTPEDTPVGGTLTSSDVDGGAPSYSLATPASHGTVAVLADGSYTYTPDPNYNGPDSFTYTVSDGNGGTDTDTVTITVTPVNDPPVANPDAKTTPEDTAVSGAVTSSDVDGGAPSYSLLTGTTNGTVVLNTNGSYTYTPAPNYNGPDSFTYTVSDGNGGSATNVVKITVTPVNDVPVCNLTPSVAQIWPPNHQMVGVTALGATDVDGDTVTMTVTRITQDESTNTVGDGNTPIDGAGVGTSVASVRAERSGTPKVPGNGRVYHISFTGNDGNGGSCSGTVKVGVPHDQGQRRIPVDDGPKFNSVTGAALP